MENIEKIYEIIAQNVDQNRLLWIHEKLLDANSLMPAFIITPRFVGKQKLNEDTFQNLESPFKNWPIDRLVRVFFLLNLEKKSSKENFQMQMVTLFDTAEINESVALFSALPYFQKPEFFIQKATDAVRSNIGDVFDSIAFENPFAAEYFTELAWNQMVLKCIFNEKPIHKILGLEKRANQNLANTLSDFAHERCAAGRSVPAQAWRLVINFVNEPILADLETLLQSENEKNRIAALLVLEETSNSVAKKLLIDNINISHTISNEKLNWKYLEENS